MDPTDKVPLHGSVPCWAKMVKATYWRAVLAAHDGDQAKLKDLQRKFGLCGVGGLRFQLLVSHLPTNNNAVLFNVEGNLPQTNLSFRKISIGPRFPGLAAQVRGFRLKSIGPPPKICFTS